MITKEIVNPKRFKEFSQLFESEAEALQELEKYEIYTPKKILQELYSYCKTENQCGNFNYSKTLIKCLKEDLDQPVDSIKLMSWQYLFPETFNIHWLFDDLNKVAFGRF